ncbi:hypothetical protein ACM01_21935 [Streptomyces viridochromogenes]|uniref:Uncharacterized protein n=1 Tax=Streptomyces viridochromogenes TaxID=1938 RepID=A0A0J7ZB85_STRVR|nr:hypothetical protein [Streptomyces viridochromogenes]KMS72697.1 hypothetical protein ACM01_21935 [Streptomyces viridochromogenes]KOG09236.1 hypothetical protein ADK36_41220 [Streptomyces viridochromogenes]KOG25288.1 hypothetical protein ADK35_09590 [Streptomyces viridochromogenes]
MIVGPYVSAGGLAAGIAMHESSATWALLFFIGAAAPFVALLCVELSVAEKVLAAVLALALLVFVFGRVYDTYAAAEATKVGNEISGWGSREISDPGSLAGGGVEGVAALITALSGLVTSVAGCLTAWVAFKQSRDNRQPPPGSRPANPPSDGRQGNPPSDR